MLPPAMRPGGEATRPAIDKAVTVLPEPDSPTSPTASPARTSKLTSFTARQTSPPVRNSVRSDLTDSSASEGGRAGMGRSGATSVTALMRARPPARSRGSSASRTPSPTRLTPIAISRIATPGTAATCGATLIRLRALAQHAAEVGHRRLRAEPQEAQAGGLQDHPANRRRGGYDHHGQHVWQQLGRDDAQVGLAHQPGGGDEVGLPQADGRAAHGAGEERHVDDDDGEHGVAEARSQRRHDRQGEQQIGERHEHIDAAHHQRVHGAAVIRRDDAEGRAD